MYLNTLLFVWFWLDDSHLLVEHFDSAELRALLWIGVISRHREIWDREARTNDDAATLFKTATIGLDFFQRELDLVCHDVILLYGWESINSVDELSRFAKNHVSGLISSKSTGNRCQNLQGSIDIFQLFDRKFLVSNLSNELVLDCSYDHYFVWCETDVVGMLSLSCTHHRRYQRTKWRPHSFLAVTLVEDMYSY